MLYVDFYLHKMIQFSRLDKTYIDNILLCLLAKPITESFDSLKKVLIILVVIIVHIVK